MRIKNLKPYYLRPRVIIRDPKEGGRSETFSDEAVRIEANIYDDIQRIQSTFGGIQYVAEKVMLFDAPGLVCLHDGETGHEKYAFRDDSGGVAYICAGDGVCVYAEPSELPDYRIKSIMHMGHLVCRLEKI